MKTSLFNRHSKILLFLACFILIFSVALFVYLRMGLSEKNERLAEVQRELADVQLENDNLERKINEGDEAELYEYLARERGYVYPDEKIYYDVTPGE